MATQGKGGEAGRSTVYLLDGTYTVFRSYYAIAALTAPDGRPTGGVYGFLSTVRKLLRERRPEHFAVAFDLEGPTHRDLVFAEYKANRAEPPEDLVPQFDLARRACEVMGWPVLTAEGFEADDVIATLARQATERGMKVVIVTADKDLYQLVDGDVVVLNPAKEDRILDPAGVEEVFGVPPSRVVDVLALVGDKVDNVPGVPGIGDKGARRLLERYGSLDALLERGRCFKALWLARERALAALDEGGEALASALAELEGPARRLAELEAGLGGAEGRDLAARFAAAAGLAERAALLNKRSLGKVLRDLEKKTQAKVWLSLADNQEQALFSRRLVTISFDAPVALDLAAMRPGQPRVEDAAAFFGELGFRRLTEEMLDSAGQQPPKVAEQLEVRLARTPAEALTALDDLARGEFLAVDTETTSLDPRHARLVGISLATRPDGGVYIPAPEEGFDQGAWVEVGRRLEALLAGPRPPKTGQNLKYDRAVLRGAGLTLGGIAFDTLVAALLVDPDRTVSHKLDDLAWRYLGLRMISYEEVAGRGAEERSLDQVDVETVARYAVEDAVVARRLTDVLQKEIEQAGVDRVFREIEMPLVEVLEDMEHHGIRIDTEILARMSAEMEIELQRLEGEIHELAGRPFNIASPGQLRAVLFDELGLEPTGRRTAKTRAHSTSQEALEALAAVHPLPGKVLEYRELAKLKSTYVDALPRLVDPDTGRVHTRFHQLGAATGRLSSSDPNLQNIPVRTPLGRRIREAFIPREGWRLVSADYSQMELRILAHMAGEPALVEAFRRGLDIHAYTASLIEGVGLEAVSPEMRSRAKAVNFGIVYGMSDFRLARQQGLTRSQARAFIEAYFERYPRVRAYIDAVKEEVQRSGEVRTLFGRRRRFDDLRAGDGVARRRLSYAQREQLIRQAVNTTIQGTAADLVKLAMVQVQRTLVRSGIPARLLVQVHDELVFEAHPDCLPELEEQVRSAMEGAAELSVPLAVDFRAGANWAEIH
ncbi:MAG: DNA polymerase I [Acidobacteriota bacterium]|nr:DNA polymerase I [Acidobacteriota bacterium]